PVAAATAYRPITEWPAVTVSPSGCYQQIDDPHQSKYFGDIAAELNSKCRNPVPEIYQSVQLWESRWWAWDRVGTRGTKYAYRVSAVTSWANVSCRNSSIKATANGYVIDLDGNKYTASTASPVVKNPCTL